MKRDWDLIREILLKIEEKDNGQGDSFSRQELGLKDITDQKFYYHSRLMAEAGLIEGEANIGDDIYGVMPTRLTNVGHDFLDNIRSQSIWSKVKEAIPKDIKTVSFELIKL
jgi:hypothetical protein